MLWFFSGFLRKNSVGGIKPKNEWVHRVNWDYVIFDEYHFGAWREKAKELFQDDEVEETNFLIKSNSYFKEEFMPISTKFYYIFRELLFEQSLLENLLKNKFLIGHMQMNKRQKINGRGRQSL